MLSRSTVCCIVLSYLVLYCVVSFRIVLYRVVSCSSYGVVCCTTLFCVVLFRVVLKCIVSFVIESEFFGLYRIDLPGRVSHSFVPCCFALYSVVPYCFVL